MSENIVIELPKNDIPNDGNEELSAEINRYTLLWFILFSNNAISELISKLDYANSDSKMILSDLFNCKRKENHSKLDILKLIEF